MRDTLERPVDLNNFAKILPNWTKEEALEIEVLEQNASKMDFDVKRCRYAEMHEEMGPTSARPLERGLGGGRPPGR